MGADIAPQIDPEEETGGFEVLPANWDILRAFLSCETQWVAVAGMAGLVWMGLDYAGVDIALKRGGFENVAFGDLQMMERAALEALSEDMP